MSSHPRLSVLMPCFNASEYITEAIDSILSQTYPDFELIISDDGSTDSTKEIIDRYNDPRIIISHNLANEGKTKTVNRLFRKAKGEFITVHDADDISHPHRFRKQITTLLDDSDLVLCGTSYYTIDRYGYILEQNHMAESYDEILSGIQMHSQFHGPTMMIRTSVLGEFSEFYRPYFRDNYEDTDLAYRIVEKGKAINLKEFLYVYRILDTSLCRKDVNIRSRNLYKVVSYLAKQREQYGTDVLMEGKPELADEYLDRLTFKYKSDPSLIYREAASYYFYWKLNQKALQSAWRGFLTRPLYLVNLRTYIYILKKLTINYLKFDKTSKKHFKEVFR